MLCGFLGPACCRAHLRGLPSLRAIRIPSTSGRERLTDTCYSPSAISAQQRAPSARVDLRGPRHLRDRDVLVHGVRLLEVAGAEGDCRRDAKAALVRAHELSCVHPPAVELA